MRNRSSVAIVLCAVVAGCQGPLGPGVGAVAHASLTDVPAKVGCVEIDVTTTAGHLQRRFTVAAGAPAILELDGLAPGAATFSGKAWNLGCLAVGIAAPDWLSAPVAANLALGQDVTVALVLQPPGGADVGVSFSPTSLSLMTGNAGKCGSVDGVGSAALISADYVVSDGFSTLFISDQGNSVLRKLDLATGAVTTLAGQVGKAGTADGVGSSVQLWSPGKMAYANGVLYLPDQNTLRIVSPQTGEVYTIAGDGTNYVTDGVGTKAQFGYATSAAFVPPATLFVGDGNTIRKVDLPSQTVTTFAGNSSAKPGAVDGVGAAATFAFIYGLAFDGVSALYVADTPNQIIRKVDINSAQVTTYAGAAGVRGSVDGPVGSARFANPTDVNFDALGRLDVADTFNGTVRRIDIAARQVSTVVGTPGIRVTTFGPLPATLSGPADVTPIHDGSLVISEHCILLLARGL